MLLKDELCEVTVNQFEDDGGCDDIGLEMQTVRLKFKKELKYFHILKPILNLNHSALHVLTLT